MNLTPCPHEKEIAPLLHAGHWPLAAPPELRTHADTCTRCADLILLTQTFRHARTQAAAIAPLDAPGILWWRAQLRRRNAALETIARPIQTAQLFTFAVVVIAAVTLVIIQPHHGIQWSSWLSTLASLTETSDTNTWSLPLILALATAALLIGVVVYLTLDRRNDRKQTP